MWLIWMWMEDGHQYKRMTIPWQKAETAQILDMAIFINETILQTRGVTQLLSQTH